MLNSLLGLADDLVKISTAPIEIAVDATRAVTRPIADMAEELTETIKEEVGE